LQNGEAMKNWYAILGVTQDAEPEAIRGTYRALAKKFHPDNTETGNAEKFRDIAAAYAVLSNPDARAQFDQILGGRPQAPGQTAGQRQYEQAQQQQGPFDWLRWAMDNPPGGPGYTPGAYPNAYPAPPEVDLSGVARDVLIDAAVEIGGGFLNNVLSQMSPFARKALIDAIAKRRAAVQNENTKARKPGNQKAG
jgi:curved DNA-binding protein CbpA